MSILSGYGKYKRYILSDNGYKLCSQWTSSNTVHFDDNKTAQTKLGAIDGITDSLTATSSNVALSAKAGKSLQDQVTTLNTGSLIYRGAIGEKADANTIVSTGTYELYNANSQSSINFAFKNSSVLEVIVGAAGYVIQRQTGIEQCWVRFRDSHKVWYDWYQIG